MRLISYQKDGKQAVGGWIDNDQQVVDLSSAAELTTGSAAPEFSSMLNLIEAGATAWEQCKQLITAPPSEAVFASSECQLLAPLPRPTQIRDCLTFEKHLKDSKAFIGEMKINAADDPEAMRVELEKSGFFELDQSFYEYPVYYLSNRMSVVGPEMDVVWPEYSQYIDYELELAAVIGKAGRKISRDNARDHIFGYTIFNDWSARDEQMKAMDHAINLGPGAGKDFANGFGPCIVTADELTNPYGLTMTARVNGEELSRGTSADMHFKFEQLIEHLTRSHALNPGEIIGSGTVGTGCGAERGERYAPGDLFELEIEGIGVLRNRVVAPHMT